MQKIIWHISFLVYNKFDAFLVNEYCIHRNSCLRVYYSFPTIICKVLRAETFSIWIVLWIKEGEQSPFLNSLTTFINKLYFYIKIDNIKITSYYYEI
ncbi:hypothetical protein MBOVa_5660 [Mycoplasmopsis bovis 8790]|nr:hypothetical protein MBOVa_5660 [Mycoplasmopsis bovis 8790]